MLISLNGIETTDFFEFREWTCLTFPMHCHYSLEVVFVTEGKIKIHNEKEDFFLEENDAIIIMPLEKHSSFTAPGDYSKVFTFQISPNLISNWDLCFGGKRLSCPWRRLSPSFVSDIYTSLQNTEGSIIDINYIFFKTMRAFFEGGHLIEYTRADDITILALKYISENYEKNISLGSVARELNVSSVYLSRVFSEKIKFKFADCVASFRIQKSVSLLFNPAKSIGEICYECGFGSIRQFNRVFKETIGCTPGEYRKNVSNK